MKKEVILLYGTGFKDLILYRSIKGEEYQPSL
jgi:hypothetical protein